MPSWGLGASQRHSATPRPCAWGLVPGALCLHEALVPPQGLEPPRGTCVTPRPCALWVLCLMNINPRISCACYCDQPLTDLCQQRSNEDLDAARTAIIISWKICNAFLNEAPETLSYRNCATGHKRRIGYGSRSS